MSSLIDISKVRLTAVLLTMIGLCAAEPKPALSHQEFLRRLSAAAMERTHHSVRYVSDYVRIAYSGGDVPADTGVCTDEVIRSYRALGIDLQKEVHEDMVRNFSAYPNKRRWLLAGPDSNIDHRRVPNLMVFFERKGENLTISTRAEDYSPGDLVTWDLGGGVTHIGIVVDQRSRVGGRYMVIHNIGEGQRWKMSYLTGRSQDITTTSGHSARLVSLHSGGNVTVRRVLKPLYILNAKCRAERPAPPFTAHSLFLALTFRQ
jgi:uncharacterized protein